jgi:hypothetical protein
VNWNRSFLFNWNFFINYKTNQLTSYVVPPKRQTLRWKSRICREEVRGLRDCTVANQDTFACRTWIPTRNEKYNNLMNLFSISKWFCYRIPKKSLACFIYNFNNTWSLSFNFWKWKKPFYFYWIGNSTLS